MTAEEKIKRYIVFTIGVLINSFGISFITKASLGTSPISSVPYVLSLRFEPTLGEFIRAQHDFYYSGDRPAAQKV